VAEFVSVLPDNMLDIDRSPLYAVFVLVVSVVRVGRHSYLGSVILLTKCVFIACCHIEATETSQADYGVSSQSDLLSPVMKVSRGFQD
jgi:hypothetical protein